MPTQGRGVYGTFFFGGFVVGCWGVWVVGLEVLMGVVDAVFVEIHLVGLVISAVVIDEERCVMTATIRIRSQDGAGRCTVGRSRRSGYRML